MVKVAYKVGYKFTQLYSSNNSKQIKTIKTRNKQTNKQNVNRVDKLTKLSEVTTISYSHKKTMNMIYMRHGR